MKKPSLFILLMLYALASLAQERALIKGMKLSKTTRVKKGTYRIDAPAAAAAITIEGDNITIDFNNALLTGSNMKKLPDEFFGTGIRIAHSRNVTIKNLKARGYKIALTAEDVTGLVLENCDLSYNYRQHLNSTQQKEDMSDWMSYHHNEKDEWLRYGAAVYLKDCDSATVRNCRVTGGQNALMLMRCNGGLIYNNDFSFNSGIGIGMYRSSGNRILYNRVIFNVRGYSHGVYNRGQDSAGMLVYEQSSNNLFYKNNVTHGGDGFFLWAGQTTMDSGEGGCNDNLLLRNDFSYAPTNGIEVTFSRNNIAYNRIFECDHGIWGGYSFQSNINNNNFRNNRIGIAIENGQNNNLTYNLFLHDKEAIRLWGRTEQPKDWGYVQHKDVSSKNYVILGNSFNSNPQAFHLANSDSLRVFSNTFSETDNIYKIDSGVNQLDTAIDLELASHFDEDSALSLPPISNANDPFKGTGLWAGRKNIRMTEWGPYDFRYPLIWNTNPADTSNEMKFDIIGPKGKWKVKSTTGVDSLSMRSGSFPAAIRCKRKAGEKIDVTINLEYVGEKITTAFGKTIAAGVPFAFSFRKFFHPIAFDVNWYSLDTAFHNPIKTGELFPPNARLRPVKTSHVNELDFNWWNGLREGGETFKQFITVAEGAATFEKGEYVIGVSWDDAVRLFIDGKLVIDEWDPSKYQFDESPHREVKVALSGKHLFRVEHIELGGFATLKLNIRKAH